MQAWAEVLGVRLRPPGLGESSVPGSPEGKFPHHTAKLWRLGPKRAEEKESQLRQFLLFELRQVTSPLGPRFLSCSAGMWICPHRAVMMISSTKGWEKHFESC